MVDEIFVVYDGNDQWPLKAFFSRDRADDFVKDNDAIYYGALTVVRVDIG